MVAKQLGSCSPFAYKILKCTKEVVLLGDWFDMDNVTFMSKEDLCLAMSAIVSWSARIYLIHENIVTEAMYIESWIGSMILGEKVTIG